MPAGPSATNTLSAIAAAVLKDPDVPASKHLRAHLSFAMTSAAFASAARLALPPSGAPFHAPLASYNSEEAVMQLINYTPSASSVLVLEVRIGLSTLADSVNHVSVVTARALWGRPLHHLSQLADSTPNLRVAVSSKKALIWCGSFASPQTLYL